jgi:hypothetical protein
LKKQLKKPPEKMDRQQSSHVLLRKRKLFQTKKMSVLHNPSSAGLPDGTFSKQKSKFG